MTKNPFDTKYAYTIICPYCGYKYPDPGEEFVNEDETEITCSHCEKEFYATRNISITYSTETMG
jgi:transposase